MIAPSFSAPHSPYWLGLTDVSHSSRQRTRLACCFFAADPAVGCPDAAALGLMDPSVMWGYNPHPAVRYSPLPSPVRGTPHDPWSGWMGWLDKGRQMRRHGNRTSPEHESPWAKLFAQGAMTTIVYYRQNYSQTRGEPLGAANDNLTSGVSFFVRLPHVCRDSASAADIKSVGLGPRPDVAGAR